MRRDYVFFVYIMASKSRVTYVGMCNDLVRRVWEHKSGKFEGFTKRYRVNRLVYFERWQYVNNCIEREKELKAWSSTKKAALIESVNPTWEDLAADWFDGDLRPKSRSLASLGMTKKKK